MATGFTALPSGWYSYYAETDERGRRKVVRNPCPGILQVQTETETAFKAADIQDGLLIEAGGEDYLGTFYGEEHREMFGELAPDESAVAEA